MLGIGLTELVMIGLALLLFLRPQDAPKLIRILRGWYRKGQQLYIGIQDELQLLEDLADVDVTERKKKRTR